MVVLGIGYLHDRAGTFAKFTHMHSWNSFHHCQMVAIYVPIFVTSCCMD